MKQKIVLILLFSALIIPLALKAQTTTTSTLKSTPITLVGKIQSIDLTNKVITVERTGWGWTVRSFFANLLSLKQRLYTYKVLVTDETIIKQKVLENNSPEIVNITLANLVVGHRIQVKGLVHKPIKKWPVEVTAKEIFDLTPPLKVIPKNQECLNSQDCEWCGQECVKKDSQRACIQIAPPEGFQCGCVNGKCQKVSSSPEINTGNCNEICQQKGLGSGICRHWTVVPKAQMGCEKGEIDIGKTTDCNNLTATGRPLLGIDKTCCCFKKPEQSTSTQTTSPPKINPAKGPKGPNVPVQKICTWCGNRCLEVNVNHKNLCPDIVPPQGITCQYVNGACQQVNVVTE